jgi:hypothetical protein
MLRTPTAFYSVDSAKVAQVLAADMPDPVFDTLLLGDDILRVYQKGAKRVVFSYRAPQLTGVWLEGQEDALQVPMPGLILARITEDDRDSSNKYAICAVSRRPQLGTKVYRAPFPNSSATGVCWGTVAKPQASDAQPYEMAQDWIAFLGSKFNNHTVNEKSKKFKSDVRELLKELNATKAKKFPNADLVAINFGRNAMSFEVWMKEVMGK